MCWIEYRSTCTDILENLPVSRIDFHSPVVEDCIFIGNQIHWQSHNFDGILCPISSRRSPTAEWNSSRAAFSHPRLKARVDSAAPAQPRSASLRYVCAQRQGSRGTGARFARALLCAALAPGARRPPPRLRSAAALLSASPQPVRGAAAAPSRGGFAPCRSRLRLFAGSPPPPLCPLCSLLWGQAGASARALRASMPPKG